MRKIRFDFERYADAPLLVLAQAILLALTGNLFFPTTTPTLAAFQTAINAYADALSAAQNRGKNEVAAKNARRQELTDLLVSLGNDITKQANGNEEALVSSGFPLTKTRQPQIPLGIVVIASIEPGLNAGQLDIKINALPGAKTFLYQYTEDPLSPDSEWISQNSTRIKETISGLQTGKRYWIRVVAYGTYKQMTVCDPVLSKIVQ